MLTYHQALCVLISPHLRRKKGSFVYFWNLLGVGNGASLHLFAFPINYHILFPINYCIISIHIHIPITSPAYPHN